MRAAIVAAAGLPPRFDEFIEPVAGVGETLIRVSASALSPLTRGRATGSHYSFGSGWPFVPGVDGVGRLDDGRRVYFLLPRAPFGAMAERTVVADHQWFELPDGIDDARAAVLANPGMSSWAALTERAVIKPGETVLINGATGAAGQLAVRIARHLGAAKVIATGRSAALLDRLGADAVVLLDEQSGHAEKSFLEHFEDRVDIVLDYLWGQSARSILIAGAKAAPAGVPVRFVQIGAASGTELSLPAAVLRSSAIEMMGSGLGSIGVESLVIAIKGVLAAANAAGLDLPYETVPLGDVEATWTRDTGTRRVVFAID